MQKSCLFKYTVQKHNAASLVSILLGVSFKHAHVWLHWDETYCRNMPHWRLVSKATTDRNNLISYHKTLVQKTSVLYKLFITFYSVTTNEGAKASCICGTTTEGARAAMLETEMKISPILLKLAFCSAVMVRLCSRIVMFPRLCSNAATRWAWNQTTQEEFVCSLPPKRSISAGILISPPSAWHCLLCKWCR